MATSMSLASLSQLGAGLAPRDSHTEGSAQRRREAGARPRREGRGAGGRPEAMAAAGGRRSLYAALGGGAPGARAFPRSAANRGPDRTNHGSSGRWAGTVMGSAPERAGVGADRWDHVARPQGRAPPLSSALSTPPHPPRAAPCAAAGPGGGGWNAGPFLAAAPPEQLTSSDKRGCRVGPGCGSHKEVRLQGRGVSALRLPAF